MRLASKVIAITGGSYGLGKALANACYSEGARIAIIGRNSSKLELARNEIGERVASFPCDIGDPAAVRHTFEEIHSQMGELHALVNNAAIYPIFKLENASDEQLRSVINTNLLGTMYCCREAIPLLKKSRGDIINVSSEAVRFYPPLLSVYTASKSALEAFSQSLRVELAPSGVRVSALRVGHLLREDASPLDDETYELMMQTFQETGFVAATGEGMQLDTVTSTAIHLLTLPGDAAIDLLELRSRR